MRTGRRRFSVEGVVAGGSGVFRWARPVIFPLVVPLFGK